MKKSILTDVMNDIYIAPDLEAARKIAVDTINASKINDASKRKMLFNIQQETTMIGLQIYLTNSMFAKLGMRTVPEVIG